MPQVQGNKGKDSWYRQGAKRCTTCDIYIKWDDCGVHAVDTCSETSPGATNTSRSTGKISEIDVF